MCFGATYILSSRVRIAAIAVSLSAIMFAQNTPASQSNPSAPGTTASENPQSSPAATAPISAVQDQSGELPPEPQRAQDQQESSKPDPGTDDPGRFVFKKQVQEVVLHATVADESGHLVTNLDKGAFSVYQNGKAEPITSFRREDVPVAMGIVIDNSGSMRDKREKVNQAVLNLILASNPQDEIFVVNFSQNSYLDQDFTSDLNQLQAALHQVSMQGSTALYDAVVASAVHLRNYPRLAKRVLLVITDGQDNMSRETLQEAMRQLQPKKGPILYAIGLTDEGLTRAGRDALQSLAASTGGVAFFPQSLDEVDAITRAVAHDIRSQYTLAYKPGGPINGYQTIRVEAQAPGGHLIVRTRSGYYPSETVR